MRDVSARLSGEGRLARNHVAAAKRTRGALTDLPFDRYVTIVEGKGRVEA
ncbi:hypothetical protein LuPra_03942 [Luteitalea pratensis]|uniref:Uncharacterized protein n=1 Tax=Luteitalea pratensis TaxID=1855912 RepID=A0A143PRC1_LUTPR|nr:hypothetical protein [Luteitalea pratensis]AMY10703.1 hypothetical protein LuPra_03942 [Luteitalea pratensis]